jgi:protocatechuate 3,4-dioxygenase beta subunit
MTNRDTRARDQQRAPARRPLLWLSLAAAVAAVALLVVVTKSRPARPKDEGAALSEGKVGGAYSAADRPRDGTITGTVNAPDGSGVQALVLVVPITIGDSAEGEPSSPLTVTSDRDGTFRIEKLTPGAYTVSANAKGYAPAYVTPVEVRSTGTNPVLLTLGPAGPVLSGRVLDAGGGPIAGALVTAEWNRSGASSFGPKRVFAARSDDNGEFAAPLQRGHYRVSVHADGYAIAIHWLDVTTDLRRDFTLEPAGSVSGTVLARSDRAPVANASVELFVTGTHNQPPDSADGSAPVRYAATQSDAEGRFSFKSIPHGGYRLVARKGALIGWRPELVMLAPGAAVESVVVELSGGLRIAGKVVDFASNGVAAAQVSAKAIGFAQSPVTTTTAPDGTFVLEGLPPGDYFVRATADRHGATGQQLMVRRDVADLRFSLAADTVVMGEVHSARGEIVKRGTVTVWNAAVRNPWRSHTNVTTVLTDDAGRFKVSGLIPGFYWLEVVSEEGRASVGPNRLPAGVEEYVDVRLGQGGSISGRVSAKGKGPLPKALVRCRSEYQDRRVVSDGDGNFTCDGLVRGVYDVLVVRSGVDDHPWYLGNNTGFIRAYGGRRATIAKAEDALTGVDLEIPVEESKITGTVMGRDGNPAVGAMVYASRDVLGVSRRAFHERATDAKTMTGADGTFTLENLPEGTFRIWAEDFTQGKAAVEHVAAGARGVALRLRAAGSIAGVVVDEQGQAVPSFSIRALSRPRKTESYEESVERTEGIPAALQTLFDPDGRFSLPQLKEGTYELVVTTGDGKLGRQQVTLAEGEAKTGVRIELGARGKLRGRVIDHAQGAGVPFCRVEVEIAGQLRRTTSEKDGSFVLTGLLPGQEVSVRLHAQGYIDDEHTFQLPANQDEADIGTLHLMAGKWAGRVPPPFPDWVVQGRVSHSAVLTVAPGGLAEKGGITPGAVILSVNDKDAASLGPGGIRFLAAGTQGRASPARFKLRLQDGTVKELDVQPRSSG